MMVKVMIQKEQTTQQAEQTEASAAGANDTREAGRSTLSSLYILARTNGADCTNDERIDSYV